MKNDLKNDLNSKLLEGKNIELSQLNIIEELSVIMADKIRNSTTVVQGFVQLLKTNSQYNEEIKDYFNLVFQELDKIEQTITELLLLAKEN